MQHAIWIIVLVISLVIIQGTPSIINIDGMRGIAESGSLISTANGAILSRDNYQQTTSSQLTVANWEAELRTMGSPLPNNAGFAWDYGLTSGVGNYFCVQSNIAPSDYTLKVINRLQERLQFTAYVDETCGAVADMPAATDLTTLSSLSLTIYVGG
jgi:hypothetical protein